ncbi:glutamate--cysteine ligase [Actinomyces minihominis]|uniref:glutamate--cysteine ligase n=1 Tax=Actinomyces minihominis TaxID=2002838 RepID=UPI000C08D034|nr:glutamate--cysteine ligase [Actinomyces minihominis]
MPLEFAESERSSIGVEWELQLVDKDSNDLRQSADTVIAEARKYPELSPHIHREMLLNTVEVTSGKRNTVNECMEDLRFGVASLRDFTDPLRIDLATAGTHPFARPAYQRVTDSRRYAELVDRTQYWGRQMLLYGVHVHVGIEDRSKVLPIINALVTRAGVLQSLSASSPFWAGEDTSYASNRAMIFQQLPTAGMTPQFHRWEELERYHDGMLRTGVIDSFDELRWDIRPSIGLGTIELRIFDACTNILEVEALASLSHCLVDYYSQMIDAGEKPPVIPQWFADENKWRSARYGMEAILILDEDGNEEHIRDIVEKMLVDLAPTAEKLGCSDGLSKVRQILTFGASYQRQRAVAEANPKHAFDDVVELMRAEMGADSPLSPQAFSEIRQANTRHKGAGRRI